MAKKPLCIAKRTLLECKTTPFAAKCSPFRITKIAHLLYISTYYAVYQ